MPARTRRFSPRPAVRDGSYRRLVIVGALVALVGALGSIGFSLADSVPTSIAEIERLVESAGSWGVAVAISLMVVHSFVPFPAELVAIANGMVYGPLWGTVITWSGAMLGAYLAFGLARLLGRRFVERMVREQDWRRVDSWVAERGGTTLLISRFLPVISFNLINYVAGLAGISWWTFTWATALGILPMTALMVVMGARMDTLPWQAWLIVLSGGVVLWLLLRRRVGLRFRDCGRKNRDSAPR